MPVLISNTGIAIIHPALLRRGADYTTSEAVGGAGNIEQYLGQHAHGRASGNLRELLGKLIGLGNKSGHLLPAADQKLSERPVDVPLPSHVNVPFERLHTKQNYGFSRPAHGLKDAQGLEGVAQQRDCEIPNPKSNPSRART